jgi:ATP adenylyltransferase
MEGAATAIHRKGPSKPLKWLLRHEHVSGKILDFGCGHGADVQHLEGLGHDVEGYDPTHRPNEAALDQKYDVALVTYVLNVVSPETELGVMKQLKSLLGPSGTAYITVRRDLPVDGRKGRGVWQRYVQLDLPLVYESKCFAIYELRSRCRQSYDRRS